MGFSLRRFLLAQLSSREAGVAQLDWKTLRFSYAQFGEDIIAEALLPEAQGFYVEAGAFHPVQISNTYLFYRKGWRGIAIDPNPRVARLFRQRRPEDVMVQCAVGEKEGTAKFEIMGTGGETDRLQGAGAADEVAKKPLRTIEVQCRRLDSILNEHLPAGRKIDFLSVDCEGHDLSVLRSNDWTKYRPRVIAVEDWEPEEKSAICAFLRERGYKLVISSRVTRFFAST
jgi:FkbM family methyltransferase